MTQITKDKIEKTMRELYMIYFDKQKELNEEERLHLNNAILELMSIKWYE